MSIWKQFEQHTTADAQQRRRAWRLLIGGCLLLVGTCGLGWLLWPSGEQSQTLVAVQLDDGMAQVEQIRAAPTAVPSPTPPSDRTQPTLPPRYTSHVPVLAANLAEQPPQSFQQPEGVQHKPGPRQIRFSIGGSGQSHSHALGVARRVPTEIVGAASEWQVQPWWKPGWVPASSDCGEAGTAAIGGHVSWYKRPAAFYGLGGMQVGDVIECQAANGRWTIYYVTEVVRVEYAETSYYWRDPEVAGAQELTLFSCTPTVDGLVVVRASTLPPAAQATN